MKKPFKLLLFSFLLFGASLSCKGQIYVELRPAVPVVVVTERPNPTYVWVGEEWNEDGRNYRYVGNYWANPPYPGYKWKQGYWKHDKKHGHQWVRGSWYGKKPKKK